ncbi:Zinc finger, SWIM-type [Plasmopara halstedii]|uniref:Zinc finger, SWIM-type n=1 Tax=Plasmopara halstedii TaxID=4781 RepID=A0A0P1AQH1_PLAHL|nr:Zinc finger, SWIM-type [Plasmopara halstedii]CEG43345.1 Zinc finger, SWIM-type [Plasmopara halstedii]|eukprot:XP_024579714.1 Zinc finger, SWIM-type [Plasmopara halstedii]
MPQILPPGEVSEREAWRHSRCARFGTTTSNSVESTNNVLLVARDKTLLDCIIDVERYLGSRWVDFIVWSSSLNHLTLICSKMFVPKRQSGVVAKIKILPSYSIMFVATVYKDGGVPVEYATDFDNRMAPCSCGYLQYMMASCFHIVAVFKPVS